MLKNMLVALLLLCFALPSQAQEEKITGKASWYGPGFHGRKTASGEIYNMYGFTVAHKKLKLGTKLLIMNPKNKKSVIVRVNDRGPYIQGREFDLSKGAATKLGIKGVAYVVAVIL